MNASIELPKYKCHKHVWALKIAAITNFDDGSATFDFEDTRYASKPFSAEWVVKHKPQPGGYWVVYQDGYQSYSPADAFEAGYTPASNTMNFGEALAALKDLKRVARKGWNGPNMFVYYVIGGAYPAQMAAIKGQFPNDLVRYRPYLALKTLQGDVATWVPSISDVLADDWYIVH